MKMILLLTFFLSSCAASTATEKRFLVGELAPKDSAKNVLEGLSRQDYLKKEKFFKGDNKRAKVSTGVNIAINPITPPLLSARAREGIASPLPIDSTQEKQCFETRIAFIEEFPVTGTTPAALDLNHWKAKLTHDGNVYDLPLQSNAAACKITKRTPQKNLSFGIAPAPKMNEYNCPSITCAPTKLDLLKPFVIDLVVSYEPALQPVKFEWIGIKESKIK